MHFEPGTLRAIERVRAGDLGSLRYFNSSFSQPVSGQNHRAKHGFWAGPVPDMGPYPLNMVRQLFGAEPLEVTALGTNSDPERFHDEAGQPFDDTVSVALKFDAARIASFTVSYSGGDIDEYRVTGTKGTLSSNPAFQVGQGIKHTTLIDKVEKSETFKTTDHFGGELKYFSECILEDHNPEPDGQEGMLDVRVLAAIEESLKTGQTVKLAPFHRSKRPNPRQVQTLDAVKEPELIASHKPSDGQ
jgi:predicted dehydrogenase